MTLRQACGRAGAGAGVEVRGHQPDRLPRVREPDDDRRGSLKHGSPSSWRRVERGQGEIHLGGFRFITTESGMRGKVHADTAVDWAGMVYLTPTRR